jgi:hypothetical protein
MVDLIFPENISHTKKEVVEIVLKILLTYGAEPFFRS